MLKTPEDFCQLVLEAIQIYRAELPKLLKYDIIVPMSYLETVKDYSSPLVFKEKVDAWWPGRMEGELCFNFHTDGGLRVNVTHYSEAPIVSWPFANPIPSLVARLVNLHHRMIGRDIVVIVQRQQFGDVPICELFDRIAMYLDPADRELLCMTMKKDCFCVYMEA